jgi:hypothetical protein
MRTACWVSFALLLPAVAAFAQGAVPLPSGGSVRCSTDNSRTRLEIQGRGPGVITVLLDRDRFVLPGAGVLNVRVIGEVKHRAIVLTDAYPSRPAGMSLCQAGEERFLRVITLSGHTARETLRVKLESCRENLELASPGLEWRQRPPLLRIRWLAGPTKPGSPEQRVIRIGSDGRPR